jgi:hypothetical protein
MMAAPLYAAATVSAVDNEDGTCTITIDASSEAAYPVGIALDVDVAGGILIDDVAVDSFFDIYMDAAHDMEEGTPGSYGYGDGTPIAKQDEVGETTLAVDGDEFCISMGGLGGETAITASAPAISTITLTSDEDCTGTVCLNALRGGIVGTDGVAVASNLDSACIPFAITNPGDCMTVLGVDVSHPDVYAMFLKAGSPEAWCREFQCKGDADGDFEGKDKDGKRVWVGLPDLNLLSPCWQKVDTDPVFIANDCMVAEFDRDFEGKDKDGKRVWVGLPDLNILSEAWQKVDTDPIIATNPCPGY